MKCKAKVVVTVLVDCDDTWSAECTVAQVRKQALDKANIILASFFKDSTKDGITLVQPYPGNVEITIKE